MRSRIFVPSLLTLLLSDCTRQINLSTLPPPPPVQQQASAPSVNLAWARNDGQLISSSPALTAQARKDITECLAAIPPVQTSEGIVGADCMSARDYHVREVP